MFVGGGVDVPNTGLKNAEQAAHDDIAGLDQADHLLSVGIIQVNGVVGRLMPEMQLEAHEWL